MTSDDLPLFVGSIHPEIPPTKNTYRTLLSFCCLLHSCVVQHPISTNTCTCTTGRTSESTKTSLNDNIMYMIPPSSRRLQRHRLLGGAVRWFLVLTSSVFMLYNNNNNNNPFGAHAMGNVTDNTEDNKNLFRVVHYEAGQTEGHLPIFTTTPQGARQLLDNDTDVPPDNDESSTCTTNSSLLPPSPPPSPEVQ
eukprot:scaffold34917_cov166-Amphora_coffeaeformis.AAC.4